MKNLKDQILEKFVITKDTKSLKQQMKGEVLHMQLDGPGFDKGLFEHVLKKQSQKYNFKNIEISQQVTNFKTIQKIIYYTIYTNRIIDIKEKKDCLYIKLRGASYTQVQSIAGAASLLTTCNAYKNKYINFDSSLFGELALHNCYMWPSDKDKCIKIYITNELYDDLEKNNFFE